MNYYPRYMGDYQSDTMHLSMTEDGAYTRLLDHYYSKGKPLPGDIKQLCRIARALDKIEQEAVATVASEFFPLASDGLRHNVRADREIAGWNQRISQANSAGHKGAESRWGTGNKQEQRQTRAQRLTAARRLGTHTETEWRALVAVCGNKCLRCQTAAADLEGGSICKDHIVPIYQGGSDAIENLQPMCRQCNTAKKSGVTDLRPADWRERLAKCLATVTDFDTHLGSSEISGEATGKISNGMSGGMSDSPTPTPTPTLDPSPTPYLERMREGDDENQGEPPGARDAPPSRGSQGQSSSTNGNEGKPAPTSAPRGLSGGGIPNLALQAVELTEAENRAGIGRVRAAYPVRSGRTDWDRAEHFCHVLIERHGQTWDSLEATVRRYAEYCRATQSTQTQHVLMPGNFFGANDEPWSQPWSLPVTKAEQRLDGNLAAAAEAKRQIFGGAK